MKLSVIIACFNSAATLPGQLDALAAQRWTEPWEVIVSDNGSTDGSVAIAERYRGRLPNLQVVDSSDRRGPAHARNVAALVAKGEVLAFCDADDEVAPGWLAAMGEGLSRYDFVACRIDRETLNPPWVLRGSTSQADGVQKFTYPPFLPHAGGGTLGVRRAIHEAVGGFDESLRCHEDTDYCWRVQLGGAELHFVPEAVVHVRLRRSVKGMFRQARGWGEYDVLLYKRYQLRGMPRLSWKSGARAWRNLLLSLPRLREERKRVDWVWNFAWRLGRLQGSIKHRVLAL